VNTLPAVNVLALFSLSLTIVKAKLECLSTIVLRTELTRVKHLSGAPI
jgi:hypothetical protein